MYDFLSWIWRNSIFLIHRQLIIHSLGWFGQSTVALISYHNLHALRGCFYSSRPKTKCLFTIIVENALCSLVYVFSQIFHERLVFVFWKDMWIGQGFIVQELDAKLLIRKEKQDIKVDWISILYGGTLFVGSINFTMLFGWKNAISLLPASL